ncbi:DUF6346 domain-containing protein [Lentzea sp. NPDC003310]|uniref:DUF6346 domain-containing protein n=1 Tax=Lentzea sp. NPDC003310 TaxID=3154447 RepID=UPI0033BA8E82
MVVSKTLHRVFAFLVMPTFGYLLGATVFTHFWDEVEIADADLTITALSCRQEGPITWHGFGFVSECRARVQRGDSTTITTVRGFLKPHLIGEPVVGEEFGRGEFRPKRPEATQAVVTLVAFTAVWLYVSVWVTRSGAPSRLRPPRDRVR